MKRTLIIIILAVSQNMFVNAQSLIISGKADSTYYEKNQKIYYSTKSRKFDKKKFIIIDKHYNYTFEIPIKIINKKEISRLFYTDDVEENKYCESQYFNLNEIIKQIKNKKTIKIYSDIERNNNCLMYGQIDDVERKTWIEHYSGVYRTELGDKKIYLDEYLNYKSNYDSLNENLMAYETGIWLYDKEKNKIIIKNICQYNDEMKIKRFINKEIVFEYYARDGIIETSTGNIFVKMDFENMHLKLR
ncbi:hypothetical protein [Flavobacterium sp. M31R6]|uniref:hypothetical protein n=1 Tax=Flavobacterium sp. M31R6 TaxID=2739062 RepID=UPI001569A280|nr:hypothetical protein [Flavobacterium sp. M31R6]QKJ63205.1 hypothetical protein HQN62_08675 [Flavobacterium sp. M31R6]